MAVVTVPAGGVTVTAPLNTGVNVRVGVGVMVRVGVTVGVGEGTVGVGGSGVKVAVGVFVGCGEASTRNLSGVGGGKGLSAEYGLPMRRIVKAMTKTVSSKNMAVITSAQP
jgi:hypothetical protein